MSNQEWREKDLAMRLKRIFNISWFNYLPPQTFEFLKTEIPNPDALLSFLQAKTHRTDIKIFWLETKPPGGIKLDPK